MKKFVSFSLFIINLFFCTNLTSAEAEKSLPPLVVGTTSGYAPFVSLNEKGDYEGFDVDVATLIGEELGREIILRDFGSMPSLMMALKQEKADLLIWAISITEDRLKKLNMIHYQGKVIDSAPFLFWGNPPESIKSISDIESLKNNTVSVEAGSSQEDILKYYPKLQVKYVDKVLDVVMDLRYGKCLTATIDPSLIPVYKQKYPELKAIELALPKEAHVYGNGIAISKNKKSLADQVESAIKKIKSEGKIAELERKWGLVDK